MKIYVPWEFWDSRFKEMNIHPSSVQYSRTHFDTVRKATAYAPRVMSGTFHGTTVQYIKWVLVSYTCDGLAYDKNNVRVPEFDLNLPIDDFNEDEY